MVKRNEPRAGRPRAERRLVKVVAYMDAKLRARVAKAAKIAHAPSVSSWAVQVLEREADRALRTGEVPRTYFDSHGPPDPSASVRSALREERAGGM